MSAEPQEFGNVRAWYVPDYGHLWMEVGHYTSFSGEIDFHGEREILGRDEARLFLEQVRWYAGQKHPSRGLLVGKGTVTLPFEHLERFADWLAHEMDPMGEALQVVATVSGAGEEYWIS